jgi:hypothetical protein
VGCGSVCDEGTGLLVVISCKIVFVPEITGGCGVVACDMDDGLLQLIMARDIMIASNLIRYANFTVAP